MSKIPKLKFDENFDYFKFKSEQGEPMKAMTVPCNDCAITTGFYEPYAMELSKQPLDIQRKCAERWWCHNNGKRSCKGVIDYLEKAQEQMLREERQ